MPLRAWEAGEFVHICGCVCDVAVGSGTNLDVVEDQDDSEGIGTSMVGD